MSTTYNLEIKLNDYDYVIPTIIRQNSYAPLVFGFQTRSELTDDFDALDLSTITAASFSMSQIVGGYPSVYKSTSDATQAKLNDPNADELVIYVKPVDTKIIHPGTYYFSITLDDSSGDSYSTGPYEIELLGSGSNTW